MADGFYRSSRAVPIVLALLAALPAAADEPAPQEIAELVAQLDSDDFDTREMAVPRLVAVGRPAIGAVGKAALAGSSEARFRAVAVLSALSRDKDEATSEAAHQVLLKVTAGDDAAAARQAEEALVPFRQLDKMRQLAEAFAIFSSEDGKPKDRLPLRPRHVQRFVDKERYVTDGTLWTLGGSGRPQVVIEVYPVSYNKMEEQWYSAVASLTTKTLVAEKVDGVEGQNWTPGSWEQEFMPVPKAPPPEEGELQRSIAMSQIARRLTAHQFWPPGRNRHELEVVAEPVLRYQDQQAGILDGGLFVIVHETNPEVLLLIEAQTIKNTPRWMYALAPMGSAAMHVQLDEEEVWTCLNPPNLAGGGTHPYWAFTRKPPQERK
jgi:hypothetical protein